MKLNEHVANHEINDARFAVQMIHMDMAISAAQYMALMEAQREQLAAAQRVVIGLELEQAEVE